MKLAFPFLALTCLALSAAAATAATPKPNIIFVMADDMGWGQTSYRGHPVLKTPNLDAMAANGLRFERFYAGSPVCSPTRCSVLTGRSPDRAGVLSHGYGLRPQEKTIAQALSATGYVTGHFGKWHLDGFSGPGAPIFASDPKNPGAFGFHEWVSVTNFFDLDPLMSRMGKFEQFKGDSSDITVAEASRFLEKHAPGGKPIFMLVWFGSPHSPFRALPEDKAPFAALDEKSANQCGEIVALDRAVGALRQKLRDLNLAEKTMLVFNSDNGGLPEVKPDSVGGLRGFKGSVFEGGLRVPAIIEWPSVIQPRITNYPACTTDLFPTVADLLSLPGEVMLQPNDGESLRPLFAQELPARHKPLGFRFQQKTALIDDHYKILSEHLVKGPFQLYDLVTDPKEEHDLSTSQPELFARMKKALLAWNESVDASFAGKDYPKGKVQPPDPPSISWTAAPDYQPFLSEWKQRPEYGATINKAANGSPRGKKKADE